MAGGGGQGGRGVDWGGVSFDLAVPRKFNVSLLMHCSFDLTVFAV